jgi:hypothetical protein
MARGAQCDVENCAILGGIDVLAGKHRRAPGCEWRLAQERNQVGEYCSVNPLLTEIGVDFLRFHGEGGRSTGVRCKEIAQVRGFDALGMSLE